MDRMLPAGRKPDRTITIACGEEGNPVEKEDLTHKVIGCAYITTWDLDFWKASIEKRWSSKLNPPDCEYSRNVF